MSLPRSRPWLALLAIIVATAACSPSRMPTSGPASGTRRAASPEVERGPIDVSSLTGRITFSDEIRDVWVVDADGSRVRRLTDHRGWDFDPSWSPDGERIAFRSERDGNPEIYAMNADGSGQRNITRHSGDDWGPAWSPDGAMIAFNSSRDSLVDLHGYVMAPDGSDVRQLGSLFVEYPTWSPDGTRIAFMSQTWEGGENYEIFVMNADGSEPRRLTRSPGSDGWPAWSPDGSRIVFSSTRDDCQYSDSPDCRTTGDIGPWHDAWVIDADGTDERRVTYRFGQFFDWSPDGDSILVAGADDLYVIRPDGSGFTELPVKGASHPLFPDWLA